MTTASSRAGTKGVPRAAREQQILGVATEEFGRHGYEATTVAGVAARVGVTKPLLHQYFGSKEDLYLACLTPVGDRLVDAIRSAMAEPAAGAATDAPTTPLRVLHALFTALDGQREAWNVLYDPSLPPAGEAARHAAGYRDTIDALAATGTAELLHVHASGTTDPLDADALTYAWRGLCTALVRWWIHHPEQSPEAMTARCARLFATARSIGPA
ncbi:AcrR family transcriptional regulator [Streptacidiphilus sp. MAP12-33]|uniref:TetR/AcrR family transcriptional regulator n=1 Tax=Streptacidiphilus sp. MAP12-33 TaxID=3156266 RepID=UPI003515CF50